MRGNSHVRFGGRPRGKGPEPRTPRRAADPTQAAKGQVGLDHYQCRGWTAWHRYTLLAMLALTILTISSGQDPLRHRPDVVKLSLSELRRLIAATLLLRAVDLPHILAWSLWRRRHQATARHSHYKRRNHPLPAATQ